MRHPHSAHSDPRTAPVDIGFRPAWLLLLGLVSFVHPAGAARFVAVGHNGGDVAVARLDGEVIVFNAPGQIAARHVFGPGIHALAMSPTAPVVVVLRRGETATIERWDYVIDRVKSATLPELAEATGLAYARGGHALLVSAPDQVAVVDEQELRLRRRIEAPGLGGGMICAVASSPRDWHVAVATADGVWFGKSDGALQPRSLALSVKLPPQVVFADDGRRLVAAGDTGVFALPVDGGGPTAMLPAGVRPSPAVGISSDSQLLYLANESRLQVIRLGDGGLHLTGRVRPDAAEPIEAVVATRWGAIVLAYTDGRIVWFRPLARDVLASWPPNGGSPVEPAQPLPVAPGARVDAETAAQRLQAVANVLVGSALFETADDPVLYVLDADYQRMTDLEDAAKAAGWEPFVLALCAAALRRPDRVPEPFVPLVTRLREVDLVNLKSVTLAPGVTPALLEAALGPKVSTGTEEMAADGHIWQLYRFGPFGLPLDGDQFPQRASPSLSRKLLEAWAGGK